MSDEERRQALTELAFLALEAIESEEPEAELGDAVLLFEVMQPPDEDGARTSTVWQKCTTERAVVATGLCAMGYALNTDGDRVE